MFQEIYKKGGRKFGLVNLGPIGCLPTMKAIKSQQGGAGECMEEATEVAKLHNKALSKILQDLESKLKGFKYSFSNFYALLEERMNNPSKYGMPSLSSYLMFFPMAKFYLCCNHSYQRRASSTFKAQAPPLLMLAPRLKHFLPLRHRFRWISNFNFAKTVSF